MNKEQKVISLELSKKIDALAKKKGIELPESEYSWVLDNETGKAILSKSWKPFDLNECEKYSYYRAYDTSELGEMLPRMIKIDDKKVKNKHKKIIGIFKLHFYKNDYEWLLQYKEWHGDKGLIITDAKTEAEARGKMLIYLISNKLL